ncbi:I78 family peptidase inhibitor [Roseisalinus antarcticus]|nr:I78 family peptidase inhibitor [Roseisalinus antarcticus]
MIKRALILCFALAACEDVTPVAGVEDAPPPPPPFTPRSPEVGDPSDPCFAGSYLGLIGRPANTIGLAETETFRIIRPGEEVTEEFVPTRMNAEVSPTGVVGRVYCG